MDYFDIFSCQNYYDGTSYHLDVGQGWWYLPSESTNIQLSNIKS